MQPTTGSRPFSPVVRIESFRTLVALSTRHNLGLRHVDVTTASQWGIGGGSEGYTKPEEEHLNSPRVSIIIINYGHKQSPRCWNTALHAHLVIEDELQAVACTQIRASTSKTEGGTLIFISECMLIISC